jgi:DNA polymerase-1
MKAIRTDQLHQGQSMSATERLWIYNGLDCCVTLEVLDALLPQLDNQTRAVYEFSKSLQGPVLEMNMRGVLVDDVRRRRVIAEYRDKIARLQGQLWQIVKGAYDVDLNWRSPDQLKHLFYEVMGYAPIKKKGKVTVDRDALEKLQMQFLARPIIAHILLLRDIAKKEGVLRTDIDPDGRMRTSFNIAGTNTGRFSSSLSDFGTGTNLQNIEDSLRSVFVAGPGMKFAYVDLEQAESRLVGAIIWNLFGDARYLDACESGDLHTAVCKLAWRQLQWSGDPRADKQIAEAPFYRQHSYRHMAKVLGHGTNYSGQPHTMALHTKIEPSVIKQFQANYFTAFPGIPRWHARVAQELRDHGHLTSLMGRRRWFFGRRDDPSTIREAIAYDPQGSVGDILNTGLLQIWRANICQILLQIHDALLVQYPEEAEAEVLPQVLRLIQVPVELNQGRTLLIPSEAKVGWNWGSWSEANPNGLKKYTGSETRTRQREGGPSASILDNRFL